MDRRQFLKNSGITAGILGYLGWKHTSQTIPGSKLVEELAKETTVYPEHSIIDYPKDIDFEWISDREKFGKVERWQQPSEYIENNFEGDCEDYAFFSTSLLNEKGYETRTVLGEIKTEEENLEEYTGFHALTHVKIDDETLFNGISRPRRLLEEDEWKNLLPAQTYWETYGQLKPSEELETYNPEW